MLVYGGGAYPAYVIDDDTLREELLDADEAREWCEETPDDPNAVSFWRMLGELDRALAAGEARLLEAEPGSPGWVAAAVRLAQVHHWRGGYAEAHDLLDDAEAVLEMDGPPELLGFVAQHRAKAFFDEGRVDEAREAALRALSLRESQGAAPSLIASTRQTLDRIESAV